MPNIKSAKKRVLVTETKTLRNKSVKTAMKTAIKKYDAAIEEGNKEAIDAAFKNAVKVVDQTAAKGVIKANTAARKKSQLAKKLNSVNA